MRALVRYGTAVGLAAALGCSDSGKEVDTSRTEETGAGRQARTPVDACALLTQPEADAILGKPTAAPEGGASQCTYVAQSGRGEITIHVLPLEFGSKEEFHAFLVKDTEATNARIRRGFEGTGTTPKESTVDPVPEVGSPAYYVDPTLVVFKGGRVLSILADDRPQAVAVAAKAVPRFE